MKEKLKTILRTAWSEPRHFFFWLTLLSLVGLAIGYVLGVNFPRYTPPLWLQKCALVCAVCLVAGAIGGFFCFILSWIPPIRRLLAWMLQRRFFVLACLVTLIALFYAEENWRGKHNWEKFKSEWEAKGEHFDMASIMPPPVPDDQNFATTPIVASCYSHIIDRNGRKKNPFDSNVVNRLDMPVAHNNDWPTNATGSWQKSTMSNLKVWQQYYREVAAKTNEFPMPAQQQSPAADVLLALSKYDSVLDELRQASQHPYSRFPLEYDAEMPASILLPHLSSLRKCVRVLQLRAIAELQNGQCDKAFDDVKLMLRLEDSIRTEPILISHLVRIAMVNITLQPVWEGLAEHKWSDAQLIGLDRELVGLDFLADYKLSMRGELAFQSGIMDYLRRHREQLSNLYNNNFEGNPSVPVQAEIINPLIPSGWIYQNQFRCARYMVQYSLPLADLEHRITSPAAARNAGVVLQSETIHTTPYNLLESMLLPALDKAVRKFANGQESVDLARVAIALERYRLANGNYPETLAALSPQFITKLPHDIINGQPLKYRRDPPSPGSGAAGGQFVLYSVGWNEMDDGGQIALNEKGNPNLDKGDWVWRYPAK